MIPGVIPTKQKEVKTIKDEVETRSEVFSLDTLEGVINERNKLIKETIWVKEKYECQLKEKQIGMSSGTDITQIKFEEWLQYWKNLRNLPNRIKNREIKLRDVIFPKKPE